MWSDVLEAVCELIGGVASASDRCDPYRPKADGDIETPLVLVVIGLMVVAGGVVTGYGRHGSTWVAWGLIATGAGLTGAGYLLYRRR